MTQPNSMPPTVVAGVARPVPLGYARPGTLALLPVGSRAWRARLCFMLLLGLYVIGTAAGFVFTMQMHYSSPEVMFEKKVFLGTLVALGLGMLAVSIVTIIFYCMWQHRVHHNARVIGGSSMRFTPGWGVGYWFIPILNIFRPYQVVTEIDRVTPASTAAAPLESTIGVWWAMIIFSFILGRIQAFIERSNPDDLLLSGFFDLGTSAIDIVALILLLKIIGSISDRQAAVVGS